MRATIATPERRTTKRPLAASAAFFAAALVVLSWNPLPAVAAVSSRGLLLPTPNTLPRGGSLEEAGGETETETESKRDETEAESKAVPDPARDGEEEESSSSRSPAEIATALRLEGKECHDGGDFVGAAEIFRKAADTLGDGSSATEDYATCRLHQALCHLKSGDYPGCIDACTDVLGDKASHGSKPCHSPAITARAYHRRAKARMALGDNAGALQDARTASFLGDGKAVNLYGKLMREVPSSDFSSLVNGHSNPLLPEASASSSLQPSPHSALLESLLSKTGEAAPGPGFPGLNPASLLMGGSGGGPGSLLGALGQGGGAGGGMVGSLASGLVRKLDDEATQETICGFLRGTSKEQLAGLASMAGLGDALGDQQLDRLARFCKGVTPKGIRRTVRGTKALVYLARLARRAARVVQRYKGLIVALGVLQWAKSAVLRPLPVNARAAKKAARLAAKAASKEALGEALKATRAGWF
ncbi:unnamed protein product [Pseudo-nitzschia multistriata]|uniref:Uncharacterized protein n=1 Tax=Pseudo-nitzschia multistriata TaxID=183589 RepID=A0A448YXJ7_9STRA|nr:unnamed protein product [Pseudo-nitzschia multistriata]